ncbi:PBP1A family penicillin-binding protein [Candidatus Nomurabacteria bacterium]|jgi:1A family penicillin-binding protein|nr:MAG: PBP1A family penicillin-binding protein [Candidatus Nomurabacteria bacterium]
MKLTKKERHFLRSTALVTLSAVVLILSAAFIWVATLQVPDFRAFEDRKISNSTKIYDKTGLVLLYDVHHDYKRTEIQPEAMGTNIKNATVAIEDAEFYQHKGIRITSIIRAVLINLAHGEFSQGGSTITQQIVKNTLLTKEKTITRKFKEWILALKLERTMTKEEILTIYLNDNPYGGSIYGIEEASVTYFGKHPIDLTLAEAAYLAAIPKAPSYYSPFGKNLDKLEERKNLVLSRMDDLHFITPEEYAAAKAEAVVFLPQEPTGIKAPHFVFFIKDYLVQKYGEDVVENGGLKVVTTLDWDLQSKAEEIVKRNALLNEKNWNATNASMVAIDAKTGQIITMVGSRDYFDKAIDGNFNIATAKRQPGSSFKPFVYATAFNKGYTPNTVVFDVPTEFQSSCDPYGNAYPGHSQNDCYSPSNYDNKYVGPINLRNALAQSRNIPAVKVLYLAGIKDAITVARNMGISTLTDASVYGLTLVLGGGEVSLLDMTSAYSTFATAGIHHDPTGIISVTDEDGVTLETYTDSSKTAIPKNTALMISDILSDNTARTPLFGANSFLYFPGHEVAGKTGTTNNNKDAWLLGYTPDVALGVWSGNNDNKPMKKGSAIDGPMWNEFMKLLLAKYPNSSFEKPLINTDPSLKPILRGVWQGNQSVVIDTVSGKLATELTPPETRKELVVTDVHSILYWVNKNDPLGPPPANPASDPEFDHFETTVQNWWNANKFAYPSIAPSMIPTLIDDVHTLEHIPTAILNSPSETVLYGAVNPITVALLYQGFYPFQKMDIYANDQYIGTTSSHTYTFVPNELNTTSSINNLKVIVYDSVYNQQILNSTFSIN